MVNRPFPKNAAETNHITLCFRYETLCRGNDKMVSVFENDIECRWKNCVKKLIRWMKSLSS
jgi:hypothetical protein